MDRIFLVMPSRYKQYYDEELSLVKTIYDNIGEVLFVKKPNQKYYVPMDKLESLKENDADKIIIMDHVKPTQIINLVRETRKEVIDRTLLILEIFTQHAGSVEAKLQIELARLKHQLPLIKEAIRYAKLGELHGYLGAGRYGYEKYYTMMRMREARIREKLIKLRETRSLHRYRRVKQGYPHIAIIGYTCAGKTTLFNKLVKQNKPVGPEPFTTLSPKSSKIVLDDLEAIVTDTVGFIRDLPHEIIEAFYATLEEIADSDIVIHVIDVSKPVRHLVNNLEEARKILYSIGVHSKPTIIALNKIDVVKNLDDVMKHLSGYIRDNEVAIPISALKETNLDTLKLVLRNMLVNGVRKDGEDIRSKIWT